MFKLVSTDTAPLTQKLAREFSEMPHTAYERTCKKSRLEFLKARLDDGHFYSPKWAVALLDGIKYRVNGQHSSLMLSGLNGNFPQGLKVVIEVFQCDSEQDLADLFMQFDHPGSSRSRIDAIGAHQAVHPELSGISRRCVKSIVAGIALSISKAGDGQRIDPDSRTKLLHDHIDFILWASQFVGTKKLETSPVAGAIFSTWNKDKVAAAQFWTLVRDESHPQANHPTRVLARFLLEHVGRKAGGGKPSVVKWTIRAFHVKCIQAWNAYRRGVTSELKYHPSAPIPDCM